MPDRYGEAVARATGWIGEGLVGDTRNRRELSPPARDTRRDRFGVKEGRDSSPKLPEHLGAVGFGVVFAHPVEVVGRQGRVHRSRSRLPDEDGRIVAAVVLAVKVP